MKEKLRNAIDLPEKAAIVVGSGMIVLSLFAPALLPAGILLAGGGYASLKLTDAYFPKNKQKSG